jgi:hypothetical protein
MKSHFRTEVVCIPSPAGALEIIHYSGRRIDKSDALGQVHGFAILKGQICGMKYGLPA